MSLNGSLPDETVDILIVDDREDGLLALEASLLSPQWNLIPARSGREALEILNDRDIGVILLDVQMPGLDGFETASLIRKIERHRHTPIVFVTAINKDEKFVQRGYRLGAIDYVFKPFDPTILLAKVSVLAELFQKTRQLERQAERIRESERRERYLKLAELEVESLRRYRSLADAIPHIVWRAKADGLIDYFNRIWIDYTGLTTEQSEGNGWQKAIHSEDLSRLLKIWLQAMRDGSPFEAEIRILNVKGEYRWHLLRSVPERRGSEVYGWIGTSTDIHDRKLIEERLREAQVRAEAANHAKTNFLANMSHEIRTPLNAILGFAELIQGSELASEDAYRNLVTIRRSGRQLQRIIDDILDISKVEAGYLEVERIEVDLLKLIDEIKTLLHLQAEEKGLRLSMRVKGSMPRMIKSDPTRMKQIFINLIGNALKFTSRGGVEVEFEWVSQASDSGAERASLRALITDTGPGIPPTDADKLFKPFSQVDSSVTRKFGGTGLGLALSKRLANMLGGDVWLQYTSPGEGSVFAVEIEGQPTRVDEPHVADLKYQDESDPSPHHLALVNLKGLNVLLADDSPDNQMLLSRFLESAGAIVEIACDGAEAIEKAMQGEHALVLMDIQMPNLDGFEATASLRERGYTRPIVALTAHAMKEARDRCLEVGCTSHLTKPIEKRVLLQAVAEFSARGLH